ncbi:hypothetical protein Hdeb2414_s0003g00102281 [Helianthus debilis subsp. tardiflorus]
MVRYQTRRGFRTSRVCRAILVRAFVVRSRLCVESARTAVDLVLKIVSD